jgi:hypothetical protein
MHDLRSFAPVLLTALLPMITAGCGQSRIDGQVAPRAVLTAPTSTEIEDPGQADSQSPADEK